MFEDIEIQEKEKGVVLVLSLLLMPVVVMMLALSIDIGIFFLHRSSMQQVADATTLAAVQRFDSFKAFENDGRPSEVDFMDVKIVILAMFRAQAEPMTNTGSDQDTFFSRGLRSIDDTGTQALMNEGVFFDFISGQNPDDLEAQCNLGDPNLNHPEHLSNCAQFGNILIHVTRGSRCYNGGLRYFCSLENVNALPAESRDGWQWANAIEMNMRADGVSSFFARNFIGVDNTNLSISSTSYLPLNPPICGHPACTDVFNTTDFAALQSAGVCRLITGFN